MKKYITIISVVLFLISTIPTHAQMGNSDKDIAISTHLVGDHGSEASIKSISLDKSLFNIKIKEGQKGIIDFRANYAYAHLNYNLENTDFDLEELDDFHSFGISISYFKFINQKWSFLGLLNPQLSSNFTDGLKGRDLNLNAIAIWNYSSTPKNRLSFGVVYSNKMGVPFPIPVAMYWKQLSPDWQMTLGFPQTSFAYTLNEKSTLSAYTEFDGYNLNLSKPLTSPSFEEGRTAENINYMDIVSGLQYAYNTEKFEFSLSAGYTIYRYFELQNNDYDTAYKFNMNNNLGFRLSFGFKL